MNLKDSWSKTFATSSNDEDPYDSLLMVPGPTIVDKKVRDVMNKRFVNRIDILESVDVKPYKFDNGEIVKTDLMFNRSGS